MAINPRDRDLVAAVLALTLIWVLPAHGGDPSVNVLDEPAAYTLLHLEDEHRGPRTSFAAIILRHNKELLARKLLDRLYQLTADRTYLDADAAALVGAIDYRVFDAAGHRIAATVTVKAWPLTAWQAPAAAPGGAV